MTLSVSMLENKDSNGRVYIPSSDSVTVTLFQEEFLAVTGRVYDRRHFESVRGATVRIEGPNGSETAATDANGPVPDHDPGRQRTLA